MGAVYSYLYQSAILIVHRERTHCSVCETVTEVTLKWAAHSLYGDGIPSSSCVAQWKAYQESRQTVIELMNEAEKKLTEFCTAKAGTSQEAEDKLCSHRVLSSIVL